MPHIVICEPGLARFRVAIDVLGGVVEGQLTVGVEVRSLVLKPAQRITKSVDTLAWLDTTQIDLLDSLAAVSRPL